MEIIEAIRALAPQSKSWVSTKIGKSPYYLQHLTAGRNIPTLVILYAIRYLAYDRQYRILKESIRVETARNIYEQTHHASEIQETA